ncbi:hypothetical protein AAHA92_23010 [Salvia divinorum]|uniref:Uncharacterized protein n=1 Tax=Salvia divinorum TaxID=28513 RepID=A0ABD1GRN1_SALDI
MSYMDTFVTYIHHGGELLDDNGLKIYIGGKKIGDESVGVVERAVAGKERGVEGAVAGKERGVEGIVAGKEKGVERVVTGKEKGVEGVVAGDGSEKKRGRKPKAPSEQISGQPSGHDSQSSMKNLSQSLDLVTQPLQRKRPTRSIGTSQACTS